ncbi:hypothetical protein SNOG_12473 [Parastagonospora nodorum SN15]|uniref:Uncharacterized protein n=1 Tax=Phaeosphaeria nodorum (strain SN15 / ATCC MYA-4574 / FGSC 10173) TaxID=321614 RepID=Q0U6Z1_PHANO|nr:hypothetical protein SNOG_12473 [Parastagonospora nodorum SN15]EAT80286.1 hypothetical protein SNOG_12473 [Parastagonospora nodorum SN15]
MLCVCLSIVIVDRVRRDLQDLHAGQMAIGFDMRREERTEEWRFAHAARKNMASVFGSYVEVSCFMFFYDATLSEGFYHVIIFSDFDVFTDVWVKYLQIWYRSLHI